MKKKVEFGPLPYGDALCVPLEEVTEFRQTSGTTGHPVYAPPYGSWQRSGFLTPFSRLCRYCRLESRISGPADSPGPYGQQRDNEDPLPDYRLLASIEDEVKEMDQIEHRRFIKCHVPLDGIPYNENVKYIHVSRELHDAFFALQNHWEILTEENLATKVKYGDKPFPRFENGGDVHQRWHDWITKGSFPWEKDGYPFWSMFSYAKSFWPYRMLPNILMVHFTDLLNDLEGQMRRVAGFIGVEVPEDKWATFAKAAHFDSMKKDLKVLQPKFDKMFKGGGDAFMDRVDGIWVDILTKDEDTAEYEARSGQLDPELREWIEKGSLEIGHYPDGKK